MQMICSRCGFGNLRWHALKHGKRRSARSVNQGKTMPTTKYIDSIFKPLNLLAQMGQSGGGGGEKGAYFYNYECRWAGEGSA